MMEIRVFRVVICGVLALLASLTSARACPSYYSSIYGDDTNGYGTGTTLDSYGITVAVGTYIESPNRSHLEYAEGNGSVTVTSALAINGEYGDWREDSTHFSDGVEDGATSDTATVGTAQTTWQWLSTTDNGNTCNYTKLTTCPSNSCGSAAISGPAAQPYICDAYKIGNFIYWYHSGIRSCFGLGAGSGSPTPGGCN
jgi:hypothetical protein